MDFNIHIQFHSVVILVFLFIYFYFTNPNVLLIEVIKTA